MDLFFRKIGSSQHQYSLWMDIEKWVVKFLSREGIIDDWSSTIIDNDLQAKSFEELVLNEESEFEDFQKVVLSKSPTLKKFPQAFCMGRSCFEDTSMALILRDCNNFMLEIIDDVQSQLKKTANKYKRFVQIGRTHGVHAEPTSFGCKFVVCWSDIRRILSDFWSFRKYLEVVTVNHDDFYDPKMSIGLQTFLSESLELGSEFSNFNEFPLERYSRYLGILSSMAGVFHKLALDLSFSSYDGVEEVRFSRFSNESYERLEISARDVNNALNDFSSMVCGYCERGKFTHNKIKLCLLDAVKSMLVLLREFKLMLDDMEVLEEDLNRNINLSRKAICSQSVMLHILKNGEFTRQEVLEDMKILFSRSPDNSSILYEELLNSPKYGHLFTKSNMDQIFSPKVHLKNIDDIYRRAFGIEDNVAFLRDVGVDESKFFYMVDRLADLMNEEYRGTNAPVTLVTCSDKSFLFLGHLMTRLNFDIRLATFDEIKPDLSIDFLIFNRGLFMNKSVIILDYLSFEGSKFFEFTNKLRRSVTMKDLNVCSLFVNKDLDVIKHQIRWYGMKCNAGSSVLESSGKY